MADDFDEAEDPIETDGAEPEEPDEGPTAEELAEAEVPGPREEQAKAKPAAEEQPDPRDQQISNLNAAMRQARHEKREAKRAAGEQAQRVQRMEQRHEVFLRRVAEATGADISDLLPAAEKPLPDATDAPIEHLTGRMEQMLAPLLAKVEGLEQQLTTRELNGQVAAVDAYVESDSAAFVAEHPDYHEAEDVVLENMARETWRAAKARYPTADEDDLAEHVAQYVGRQIGNLKVGAFRDRRSLAEVVYAVAQRSGWKPGQAPAAENGKRPSTGKVGALKSNLSRTGATVTGLERAARKPPVSVAALADMDDDEFDKLTSDPKQWKRLTEAAAG